MHPLLAAQPAQIRELTEKIETHTGLEIELQHGPIDGVNFRIHRPKGRLDGILFHHSQETPAASVVAHELLHMQRYLIEGVPQLSQFVGWSIQGDSNVTGSAAWVEDQIEHWIIVPESKDRFGIVDGAVSWLTERLSDPRRRTPPSKRPDLNFKWAALLDYVSAEFFSPAQIYAAAELLKIEGLSNLGRQLAYEVGSVLIRAKNPQVGKEGAVMLVCKALGGLRGDMIRLLWIDGRARTFREKQLTKKLVIGV
jgi:hypothetical protein